MLKEIYIENLAVIEKAVIPFSDSFNVLPVKREPENQY